MLGAVEGSYFPHLPVTWWELNLRLRGWAVSPFLEIRQLEKDLESEIKEKNTYKAKNVGLSSRLQQE